MENTILRISMVQIREWLHGKPHFDNFHGSNQGKVPWKTPFCEFPWPKARDNTMEISVLSISMVGIGVLAPWKYPF
ncbi:MAG: hypothetical protein IK150_04740 [Lachnospiraceae bacterium]|nr:hypothetical protein [Lachnospiraceae bacterium]